MMPDGTLPAACASRLRRAEARQRRETKERGLYAEPVSIDGLWLLQRGLCACGCKQPLDPVSSWDEKAPPAAYPVIAHVHARGSRGVHSIDNVRLWRFQCNRDRAVTENTEVAKVKRFTVNLGLKPDRQERPAPKRKIQSRGFATKEERMRLAELRAKRPLEDFCITHDPIDGLPIQGAIDA